MNSKNTDGVELTSICHPCQGLGTPNPDEKFRLVSEQSYNTIRLYLAHHEIDIHYEENDFGNLWDVFKELIGKTPEDNESDDLIEGIEAAQ